MGMPGDNAVEFTVRANDDFSDTLDKFDNGVNQQVVESLKKAANSARMNSDAYRELDTQLEQLLTRVDPLYRAQLRLDQGQELLHRGLQDGLVTQSQYSRALGLLQNDYTSITEKAGHAAHASSTLTREIVVLGHEAMMGNFGRIPGTLMVLGSYIGGLAGPLLAFGAVALGVWHAFAQGGKDSKQAVQDLGDTNKVEFDKINKDLQTSVDNLYMRIQLQKQGIQVDKDEQAQLLTTLRVRIQGEAEAVAANRDYTVSVIELTRDTERYNQLVNMLAQEQSMKKEYETSKKAADELNRAIKNATESLQAQVMTFGMGSDAAKEYELRQKGATDAQLKQLDGLRQLHEAELQHQADEKAIKRLLDETRTPLEVHEQRLKEINDLYTKGSATTEQYNKMLDGENRRWAESNNQMKDLRTSTTSVFAAYSALEHQHEKSVGTTAFQIGKMLLDTQTQVARGMGQIMATAILDNQNLAQTVQNVMKGIASNIISTFFEVEVQHLIAAKMGAATDMTAVTARVGGEAAAAYAGTFAWVMESVPWPYSAAIAPAAAGAAAATLEAGAAGFMVQGFAHGGLDYVPAETTFMLQKGERVVSPQQNKDLTSFLDKQKGGGGGMVIQNLTIHILENAVNAEVFSRMTPVQLRAMLGQPIIDALNQMYKMGVVPTFATQKR